MSLRNYLCQHIGYNLTIHGNPEREVRSIEFGGVEYTPEKTCKRITVFSFGKTTGEYKACSRCRSPLSVFDNYCSQCGAKVVDGDN